MSQTPQTITIAMEYCEELGYWTNSDCCELCEMRYFCEYADEESQDSD